MGEERAAAPPVRDFLDIVCLGPPRPDGTAGAFVCIEDPYGHAVELGEWVQAGTGREATRWRLRIPDPRPVSKR